MSETPEPDFYLTDHAILRYLERICDVDVAKAREELRYLVRKNDPRVVWKYGKIVTFLDVDMRRQERLGRTNYGILSTAWGDIAI